MSDDTPFTRFWQDLNRNLESIGESEALYGEAHDAFRSHYTAVNAAFFIRHDRKVLEPSRAS